MDVNMLNYVVLQDNQELIEEPGRLNQVSEMKLVRKSTTLRKRIGVKRYTYSQIFSFKYFSWFLKSNRRYQIYLKDCETLRRKLDLKDFLINQGHANMICSLIMKPYQIKLMSQFEKETGSQESAERQAVKIEDAVDKLIEDRHDLDAPKIKDRLNSGLFDLVKKDESIQAQPFLNSLEDKEQSELQLKPQQKKGESSKSTKKNVLESSDAKSLASDKKKITPPFDPFGITPEFYIKGESKTTSWIGFVCSIFQIAITAAVIVIYTKGFLNKDGANITILNVKSQDRPFFDLSDAKQLFVLTHFILGIDPQTVVPLKAFMVEQNTRTLTTERTPLPIVSCSLVQDKLDELKLKIKPGEFLEYQDCLVFPKGSLIGKDKKQGIKRTVQIEVSPCLTGCYTHDFGPMLGLQEISPLNPFPFFPVYPAFMHQFNFGYQLVLHYMNTVTDFENYDKPTSMFLGLPEEFQFSLQKEQIATISFE